MEPRLYRDARTEGDRTLVESSTLSDETSSTSTLATYKLQTTRHADGSLPG